MSRTIQVLWPTVRPEVMKSTWRHWMTGAAHPEAIHLTVAVNDEAQREALAEVGAVIAHGCARSGAAFAVAVLCQLAADTPGDIVVLGADDIFAPPAWDEWIREQFRDFDGAIVVDDGGQYGACITQPVMTFACLLKLNRVVLHPSYHHFYADAELFANLSELGLLRDLRRSSGPVFEHRNWAWNKREKDAHDAYNCTLWERDSQSFQSRMRLPLAERLKIDDPDLARVVASHERKD